MGLNYWEQFVKTGRVEDYLGYKNQNKDSQTSRTQQERAGVGSGERDNHSYRDGASGIAHR